MVLYATWPKTLSPADPCNKVIAGHQFLSGRAAAGLRGDIGKGAHPLRRDARRLVSVRRRDLPRCRDAGRPTGLGRANAARVQRSPDLDFCAAAALQKAGADRVILRADPVTGRLAVRLACKRSRTAFTSRSRCCEYRSVYTLTHRAPGPRRSAGVEITRTSEPNGRNRNGQSARLDTNFRPQNYGAVGKTLLATTMIAEFSIFQWVLPLERSVNHRRGTR